MSRPAASQDFTVLLDVAEDFPASRGGDILSWIEPNKFTNSGSDEISASMMQVRLAGQGILMMYFRSAVQGSFLNSLNPLSQLNELGIMPSMTPF